MSQLFTSACQNIGVSASTSVLSKNIQDGIPLGGTGWISLQSKGLSRVFSNTTVEKHHNSDKMWSTGEGNGKPLQYSCLENTMNSMKKKKKKSKGLPNQTCVFYCHLVVIYFSLLNPEILGTPLHSLTGAPSSFPLQKLSSRNSAGTRNQCCSRKKFSHAKESMYFPRTCEFPTP